MNTCFRFCVIFLSLVRLSVPTSSVALEELLEPGDEDIDSVELAKIFEQLDLSAMLSVPYDSSETDLYADLPLHLQPIELQPREHYYDDPKLDPLYLTFPKSIQKLIDTYGYDIPPDVRKKVSEKWFTPARGKLKHRKPRNWGNEKLDVFALHNE